MKGILNLDPSFFPITDNAFNTFPEKTWEFKAGEVGIKLYDNDFEGVSRFIITTRLNSSYAIMQLLMAVDAIRRIEIDIELELFIPYIPYSRDDRVMVAGQALSIYVFATLINSLGFKRVYYMTPHSDVAKALINNGVELSDFQFISSAIRRQPGANDYFICSPDVGAIKRTMKTAYSLGYKNPVAIGLKERDVNTGQILSTSVDIDDFEGKDVYIIDDICSGGRTFLELGRAIQQKNPGKIYLIVTHFEGHENAHNLAEVFETVYYTDSLCTAKGFDLPYFEQLPLSNFKLI